MHTDTYVLDLMTPLGQLCVFIRWELHGLVQFPVSFLYILEGVRIHVLKPTHSFSILCSCMYQVSQKTLLCEVITFSLRSIFLGHPVDS